ncbi:hypothetical protein AUR64_00990 [Haloprofundus marisrubri]|uniref:SHOCT domain-containing protein n=1 Tax=Haloprofundus marisrubri TaxID=1514971 RepID=A0A0W1R4E1_9EURY|nr:SHOCT domain-containing protein [Haloprofundus marisrubri]KTG08179.1 hypothetical protein AUR64_00990 [Haloprofundus marisrubri]
MASPAERARTNATEIASLLVLGAGFLALFGGFELFFLIWILGFVVFVPLVELLFGEEEEETDDWFSSFEASLEEMFDWSATSDASDDEKEEETDPLVTLRERYARGELSDEMFEQKLERLLETETYEGARERVQRSSRERYERSREYER